jgi:D-alanyl-D-alanine carboxypeptidase
VAVAAIAGLAACSGEHASPRVPSPFDPPTTEEPAPAAVARARDVAARDEPGVDGPTGTGDTSASTATTEAPPTTVAPSTTIDPVAWASFNEALADRLLGSGDYAVGVAVARHGEIIHTAEFGHRVPQPTAPPAATGETAPATSGASTSTSSTVPGPPAEPIEPGDRFRIASISKVITAIVVLQLVEAGQLGLDEAVGARLAEHVGATVGDPQIGSITVRQLLAHTSGLPVHERTFFRGQADSCPAAARYGLSGGLVGAPGTQYTYSNLNYCLLGLLVEDVAGRPYEAVVTDRLLTPLGITGMRLASTFDEDPAQVVHPSGPFRNYMEVLGAAGSWVATPSDVVTILASLDVRNDGFHPLSAQTVELMRTPVITPDHSDPARGYGLGMMVFGDGSFGHTGTVENTHAMVVDRPDGITWSILVSGEYPGDSGRLAGIFDGAVADAGVTFS